MSKKRDPGLSYPDPTKVEVPLKLRRAAAEGDRLAELMARLSDLQRMQGNETLEEADDFDVPEDEPEFVSRYELHQMQEEAELAGFLDTPPQQATPPADPPPAPPVEAPEKP